MYCCDNCNKIININNANLQHNHKIIKIKNKNYIHIDNVYTPLLCQECFNSTKHLSWTKSIANHIIQSINLVPSKTPIEEFYEKYPEFWNNYLVHLIKDKEVYIKYFKNIYDAYEYMKDEFYEYINKYNGIDEELITYDHEVVFGHIKKKEDGIKDIYFYDAFDDNYKERIDKLFKNNHLTSDNLTFNPNNNIDENYFNIKLVTNKDNRNCCIICDYKEIIGYKNNNYCKKHHPFPYMNEFPNYYS